MTSEEALGILYSKADTTNECWECRQTIEKDLEVLETLKPHLKLQNIGTTPKQEIVLVMDENMAGYEKLKEWLENEKINNN